MGKVNIDIAEIAKTEIAKNTANWIFKVIGEPIENVVGYLFADALKEKRTQNIIKLKKHYEDKHPTQLRSIPLSFAYKLLEKASLEEDDYLITKWAELLANTTDVNFKGTSRKIYIDILDSLESNDARLLETFTKTKEAIDPIIKLPEEIKDEVKISIDTLISLNLVDEEFDEESDPAEAGDWDDPTEKYVRGYNTGRYYLTNLGASFLEAVTRK
jgi:hypothetical protein